jgi:hypothetical protein
MYMLPLPAMNITETPQDPDRIQPAVDSSALEPEAMIDQEHSDALSPSEQAIFERSLVTNAATLCSV